tara:strand:- start:287 stop:478 length:192 start_codon:yes stop_codon:yes gene_type:complete
METETNTTIIENKATNKLKYFTVNFSIDLSDEKEEEYIHDLSTKLHDLADEYERRIMPRIEVE